MLDEADLLDPIALADRMIDLFKLATSGEFMIYILQHLPATSRAFGIAHTHNRIVNVLLENHLITFHEGEKQSWSSMSRTNKTAVHAAIKNVFDPSSAAGGEDHAVIRKYILDAAPIKAKRPRYVGLA